MDKNITIIINTYNEEKNIDECIESVKLLTENILMVDMGSTDKTLEIAKKHHVKIKTIMFSRYVEPGMNEAIKSVTTDWFFIVDADERLTPELALEINNSVKSNAFSHYSVSRKNIFAGKKWLRHGGFGPEDDQQIRLINKKFFVDWPKQIHSKPIIKGELSRLKNLLIHYFHNSLETMVDKTSVFEDIESDLLFKAGRKVNSLTLFRKFLGELNRRLIKKQGWRDGSYGIIESFYQAYSKTITYLYLYEKRNVIASDQVPTGTWERGNLDGIASSSFDFAQDSSQ